MRIVIATPLYPPETAEAAAYAKELACRLATSHRVTVVAYAHLPEQSRGVRVIEVDKRQRRLPRLSAFRRALATAAKDADAVIAINGVSVEVPLLTVSLPATVLCLADKAAHERAGILERLAASRAKAVVREIPGPKPEILPLDPEPKDALATWERAWTAHLLTLEKLLGYGS